MHVFEIDKKYSMEKLPVQLQPVNSGVRGLSMNMDGTDCRGFKTGMAIAINKGEHVF